MLFNLLCSIEGISSATISKIGGLHDLLGLREYALAAAPRDSDVCLPESNSTNKFGASFETPSGRHLVGFPRHAWMRIICFPLNVCT